MTVIDMHAHFESRMLDLDAMIAKMDHAGVDRVALIPTMNDVLPHTPDLLLAVMRGLMQSDVTRPLARCVHRITLNAEGNLRLRGGPYRIYKRPDNASVADALRRYPTRLLGWIFLNPRDNPDVLDELERWREVPGMIGIKLHPHWHDYRTRTLWPVFQRASELRMPVLIHLGFGDRGAWRDILDAFPELVLISAHAGFPFYQSMWRHGRDYPNLYVDLSSPYIDERLARKAVEALGPERCLYGTDAPYGFPDQDHTFDYTAIKGWVERMPVAAGKIEGMLGGNIAAVLDRAGLVLPA